MASQSLYRKWRSQTFDEMVGQEPIVRTLKNALKSDNLGHAYLFTGPRGTGKTTTARLLAKTVNCTNPQNNEPCNECQQCQEITLGNSFNVIEIDAASNRGIDSIRELREKVMMPPSAGKYKIYILDEAHMLTTEAFNALLKTLEEPPEYAIFVMATTDVHKMLPTVLSRCQRFDFKRISTGQITRHLLFVAGEEHIELEKSAAELIARTAAGGMRDALSLLDQAIAYSGEAVSLALVQSMLGVADPRAVAKLIGHIARLDSPALLYLIHELSEAGADLRQLNAQVVEFWRALMLAKAQADIATILDLTEDEVHEVHQLVPHFTLDELTECTRIFAQNDLMQRNQATPQLGLELAALDCTELHRRVQQGGSIVREGSRAAQAATMPAQPATQGSHQAVPQTVPPAVPPVSSQPQALSQAQSAPVPLTRAADPAAMPAHPDEIRPSATTQPPISRPAASGTSPNGEQAHLTVQRVLASWDSVKKRTMQRSSLLGTYVGMCDVMGVEYEEEHVVIVIRAAKLAHLKAIKEGERPRDIEWALSTEFNLTCKVRIIPPDQTYAGPKIQNLVGVQSPPTASPHREPAHHSTVDGRSGEVSRPETERARPFETAAAPLLEKRAQTPPETPPHTRAEAVVSQPRAAEKKRVPLSQEELGQKVNQNPVVQEFLRTFRADIADIQSK